MATATPTPASQIATPEDTPRVAPGALELVRTFVNTVDVETGDDVLAAGDPKAVKAWFVEQDLLADDARVTAADAKRVVEAREALRALLLANNGEPLDESAVAVLNDVAGRSPLEAQFGTEGTIAVTGRAEGVDGALGQLLAIVVQAVVGRHLVAAQGVQGARLRSGRSTTSPATDPGSGASWRSAGTGARRAPTGTASATTDERQRAGAPPHIVSRMSRR